MDIKEEKIRSSEVVRKRRSFSPKEVEEIVARVESGMSAGTACRKYGMSRGLLWKWMQSVVHPSITKEDSKKFTKTEKRSIIRSLEEGRTNLEEIKAVYYVEPGTVDAWIRGFNREEQALSIVEVMVSKQDDDTPLSAGEKQALEQALKDAELKIKALNTLIDVAEEQFKISIRKKAGAKQSKE